DPGRGTALGPGALLHPLDALRRRAGLATHRHLWLSPRGARALQRRAAFAAGAAREAGAAARARARAWHLGRGGRKGAHLGGYARGSRGRPGGGGGGMSASKTTDRK